MIKLLEKLILKFHNCDNNYKLYSTTKINNEYTELEFKCTICDKSKKFDVTGYSLLDIQDLYYRIIKTEYYYSRSKYSREF